MLLRFANRTDQRAPLRYVCLLYSCFAWWALVGCGSGGSGPSATDMMGGGGAAGSYSDPSSDASTSHPIDASGISSFDGPPIPMTCQSLPIAASDRQMRIATLQ